MARWTAEPNAGRGRLSNQNAERKTKRLWPLGLGRGSDIVRDLLMCKSNTDITPRWFDRWNKTHTVIVIVIILRTILDDIVRLWQLVIINVICDIGLRAYSHDSYSDDKFPIVIVTFVNVPSGHNKRDTLKSKWRHGGERDKTHEALKSKHGRWVRVLRQHVSRVKIQLWIDSLCWLGSLIV